MSQSDKKQTRREVLYYATAGSAVVTGGALVGGGAISQMGASADVRALSKIQVDISGLEEGGQMVVEWQLKPVFIRHRTPEEIEAARDTQLSELKDVNSERVGSMDADASDTNRALDEEGKYLVAVALCTHLGCVPTVNAGDFHGWYCPCHGSHYDTSGRIRKGPATRNLLVPPMRWVGEPGSVLEIGEA